MPAITDTNSTILVTGANGFLGTWIVDTLLARGYSVRAAVRTKDKGLHLATQYKSYGDKLQIFAIGNMEAEGAWDQAVEDVDGVIHSAADSSLDAKSPQDIIAPAVKGVLGILESIQKYGTAVKRVVFTSSSAAIKCLSSIPVTLSEDDWNDDSVKECDEKGDDAWSYDMYSASKTLAEKEGWEWYKQHKSSLAWDIVTLLPSFVFGPMKHEVKTIEQLNSSSQLFYQAAVLGNFNGLPPLAAPGHGFCDVRDVAEAHARALETAEARNERILLIQSSFVLQDALDAVNSVIPSPWKSHTVPFPKGDLDGDRVRNITWNLDREKRIFGMRYRTFEETARDILADYEQRGWQ
ncbi:hypothetical protein BC835DRAFT_323400 [Cytidiella melzeri]|nr:hypothetical protein BC835DRAFT_323400 [Cytidiella melzeri]